MSAASPASVVSSSDFSRPLFRYSLFVVFATLFLIFAGGLVTSNQAGLTVPDWPLSYGQFFPPMKGLMVFEHGHRVIAGTVGIFALILTIWISAASKQKSLIGFAWLAIGLVFIQALLGGLTVLLKLPPAVSASHAVIGQTFFVCCIVIAFFLSPYYQTASSNISLRDAKAVKYTMIGLGLLYVQLMLGAWERHTSRIAPEHIGFGLLVAIFWGSWALKTALSAVNFPALLKVTKGVVHVLMLQIFLGIGAYVTKIFTPNSEGTTLPKVIFTATHQTCGAVLLGLAVFALLLQLYPASKGASSRS